MREDLVLKVAGFEVVQNRGLVQLGHLAHVLISWLRLHLDMYNGKNRHNEASSRSILNSQPQTDTVLESFYVLSQV